MAGWTQAAMADQSGRVAVVTGASSGIGAAAAEMLAAKGAEVVLAVRDAARGEAVRRRIVARNPGAKVRVSLLDLADLASVRAFAGRIDGEVAGVDVLLNNAGLGMQPARGTTADGFERQFGTNHLGHFALTGLMVPVLLRAHFYPSAVLYAVYAGFVIWGFVVWLRLARASKAEADAAGPAERVPS